MTQRYNSEDTINDILNAAAHLFIQKGYEKTSIQDIVNELDGLTRGAIYHHFNSKDEIVDAVVKRLVLNPKYIDVIIQRQDLNGLEKLQHLFLEGISNDESLTNFTASFPLLDNPKLFLMHVNNNNKILVPYVEQMIITGNQDGSINVPYPKQIAEVVILLLVTWYTHALFPTPTEEIWDKNEAAKYVLSSIGLDILSDDVMVEIKRKVAEAQKKPD
ncbi:TetR/AcrR family transcriptional regulator [uncultured Vagococcus sp.]|uniref:TetR/AcrR family transcriptional regulator n=1 Tax=uncultured Vagococcus sp. TaxID=189676 RepID=UPI0028D2A345|nr:TetR/AcrR family transcriptional regulator [uncultured Vagococcus sp.]